MTRSRYWLLCIAAIIAAPLWLTSLRAANPTDAPSQSEQIADLVARLEKMEKRITVLETMREHATRQANAVDETVAPRPVPMQSITPGQPGGSPSDGPQSGERDWPPARIRLLKQSKELPR